MKEMPLERFYCNGWANSYVKPVSLFKIPQLHPEEINEIELWKGSEDLQEALMRVFQLLVIRNLMAVYIQAQLTTKCPPLEQN